ncbi:MAG: substrate-binding domain-containing protein [Bacteroidia bacterium]|nr:substrate-binding domain-containing protein [Bacteroidia bacterium]
MLVGVYLLQSKPLFLRMIQRQHIWTGCFLCLLTACQTNTSTTADDTPTTGNIRIAVDEAFQPVIDSELTAFHHLYPQANISPIYCNEARAFELLLQDSVRLIVAARMLRPEERQVFQKAEITPRITQIAKDAVALIVHPSNSDTTLTTEQWQGILSGKITQWSQLGKKKINPDKIDLVFDQSNSGIVRFLQDSILKGNLPSNAFAKNGHNQVIEHVKQTPNALGLIALNWISDREDSTVNQFLSGIKVLALQSPLGGYVQPYAAYLRVPEYPLTRSVYIISREAKTGLGTGFVSYVAGEKGQRIILKADLLPATQPIRLIELKQENIQ